MTDPDAPVPYWPVYYSPEAHVMDSVPGNYYPTRAAEAELDALVDQWKAAPLAAPSIEVPAPREPEPEPELEI